MHLTSRTFCIALASIVLVAFVLRIGLASKFVGLNSPPDVNANPDQVDYEWGAYQLSEGNGLVKADGQPTAIRTPGAAVSLAPAYAVFGRSFAAGRIWFCLISAATCLGVAWVAYQLAGRGAALAAAALLAVYPGHAYYAMHFLSEVPYCFYLAFATALTIRVHQQGGKWHGLLAGICWGMAIHCRPQLLLLLPIVLVVLVVMAARMARPQWMAAMRLWAVQCCIVAVMIAPWMIRNAVVLGKPVMSTIAGHGWWGSHNTLTFHDASRRGDWVKISELEQRFGELPRTELAKDEEATRRGWASIAANLPRVPQLVMHKVGRFVSPFTDTPNRMVRWAFALSWIAVIPLMLIGTWQAWRHARQSTFILLMPVLATFATVVLFYGSVRFRDSIAPLFIAMAGIGAAKVLSVIIGRSTGASEVETEAEEREPLAMPKTQERRAA